MKLIGRIIMLLVGAAMLFFGINYWIEFVNLVGKFEWNGVKNLIESLPSYVVAIKAFTFTLFGISAVFSFIRGKTKMKYFFFSAIIIAVSIFSIVVSAKEGTFEIGKLIGPTFLIPAFYLIGSIFLFV